MKKEKQRNLSVRCMALITCVCLIAETLSSFNTLTAYATTNTSTASNEASISDNSAVSNDNSTLTPGASTSDAINSSNGSNTSSNTTSFSDTTSSSEATSSSEITSSSDTTSSNEATSSSEITSSIDTSSSSEATSSSDTSSSSEATSSNDTSSSGTTSSSAVIIDYIAIDKTTFPDEFFSDYIYKNIDINEDKKLSQEEISSIVKMDVSNLGISTLKGLEYFTNLTELNCSKNQLTSLNVDLLINLTSLNCSWNHLTSLDLSKNTKLSEVDCTANSTAILVDDKNSFDLSAFSEFPIDETKNWSCTYTVEDNLLIFDSPLSSSIVTYEGNLNSKTLEENYVKFTLVLYKVNFDAIEINETNFPDTAFNKLITDFYDKDKNFTLDSEELSKITSIDISTLNITDLTGIQFFQNLIYFNNSNTQNNLTNTNLIPVSTILFCDNVAVKTEEETILKDTNSAESTAKEPTTDSTSGTDTTITDQVIDPNVALTTTVPANTTNIPANTTSVTYTINFDTIGGSLIDPLVVNENTAIESANLHANPTKSGCIFDGWYFENNYITKFTSISPGLTQNIILFAKWTQIVVNPTEITNATNSGKGKLSVAYNEIAGVSGYEVLCSTAKNFNSNIRTTTSSATNLTVKNLIKNKTYYVKVRGFIIDATGGKVYGDYSSVKKVKVKSGVSEVNPTSTSASISSCKITDSNTVTIKAKAKNIVKSSDSYYYLFSVPSTQNNLKKLQPIATSEKDTSFTFTANLDQNGSNYLLHSKFVVAIKQKSSYKIISAFKYIANPEAVAKYTYDFPTAPTKKGLQGFSTSLGVNHTVINIEVNDFIATTSEYESRSTDQYSYKGKTYYFRRDVAKNYASTAKYFSDKGAVVYAILLMGWSSKTNLIAPGARKEGFPYYAWNVKDKAEKEQLEAAITYFAEYCCNICGDGPGIAGWIVGNEVDNFDTWNYAGTSKLDSYAKIYADTFRLVYNATKSVYSNARVYISLDHMWAMSNEGSFGSKAFLDKFNSLLASEGNIDWDIAYHPYPVPLTEPNFWKNDFISNSENSEIVNMKNLNVLTNYVKKHYGKDKRIILSEVGFTSDSGEKLQAAAIAYAYYVAEFNPMVDAFIMRSLEDADVEVAQGLSFGITGKQAYDVYKYMDTPQSENYTKFALKVIGTKKWKSIVPKYNASKFKSMPSR